MAKRVKEFEFFCEEELQYHSKDGALINSNKLILKAPSMSSKIAPLLSQDIMIAIKANMPVLTEEQKEKARLEQAKLAAQQSSQNNKKGEEDSILDSKTVIALLYSTTVINMATFKERFISLLNEKNICLLDNICELNKLHLESISYEDSNRLMGEYIANFLIP